MRWRLLGGIAGPAVFVAGWAVLGATTPGYSATRDQISRLAEVGASTQPAMTAAFVGYAAGVAIHGTAIGDRLGRPAAVAAFVNAAATLGVAATPLESAWGGAPHAVTAGTGYASLTALPLLAARHLWRTSSRPAATASAVCGVAAGTALLTSMIADTDTGLWQRLGLTIGDVWIAASAVGLLATHRRAPTSDST